MRKENGGSSNGSATYRKGQNTDVRPPSSLVDLNTRHLTWLNLGLTRLCVNVTGNDRVT